MQISFWTFDFIIHHWWQHGECRSTDKTFQFFILFLHVVAKVHITSLYPFIILCPHALKGFGQIPCQNQQYNAKQQNITREPIWHITFTFIDVWKKNRKRWNSREEKKCTYVEKYNKNTILYSYFKVSSQVILLQNVCHQKQLTILLLLFWILFFLFFGLFVK